MPCADYGLWSWSLLWADNRPASPRAGLNESQAQCAFFHLSWPVSGLARPTFPPSHAKCTVAMKEGCRMNAALALPLRGQHALTCGCCSRPGVSRLTAVMDMTAGTRTAQLYGDGMVRRN